MSENFDLFGNPVRERRGMRGRPPYEPTTDDVNKIKLLLALGKSIPVMANALGVSPATVKRYFRAELKVRDAMRDRMETAYALKLWAGVQEGNAAAMRLWMLYIERNDRMDAERNFEPQHADESAGGREGKKVLAAQRATEADADLMAELEREASAENVVH